MKKHHFTLILALLLASLASVAAAQEACTLPELRAQVEAMGGRWTGTYEAKGRSIPVDAPILLPEADALPVLTVSRLQPDEGVFNEITAKGEHIERLRYVITPEGGDTETRPGMSDTYECSYYAFYERSIGHEDFSYPHVCGVSVEQGECYKQSRVGGKFYHGINEAYTVYEIDPDAVYAEDSDRTPNDVLRLMQSLAETYYPGAQLEMGIDSMVTSTRQYETNAHTYRITGEKRADSYEGTYSISFHQLLRGIPVFRGINEYDVGQSTSHSWTAGTSTGVPDRRLDDERYEKINRHEPLLSCTYRADKAFDAWFQAVGIRSVEAEDVPLAPLSDVLASVEALIASGNIREVRGLRLGYVLYPDSDTKDFLWAVPRWLVECTYAKNSKQEIVREQNDEVNQLKWLNFYDKELLVDAQTAEAYNFTALTREQFSTPGFLTWK